MSSRPRAAFASLARRRSNGREHQEGAGGSSGTMVGHGVVLAEYCSSVTFSSHSTAFPSSDSWIAM